MEQAKSMNLSKRALLAFISLFLAFGFVPLRLMSVMLTSAQKTAGGTGSGKVITVSESRGLIYDCNGERLVGCKTQNVAAVKPTAGALALLKEQLTDEAFEQANAVLSTGQPMIMKTNRTLLHKDILLFNIFNRTSSDLLACHLIGYTDETGNGVCGLEKSLNDELNRYRGAFKVRFRCDATGKVLPGADIETVDENYNCAGGVVLTLNKAFQQSAENAMDACGLKTGAAVILDCSDGGICAMASRPRFDPTHVADSLSSTDSPLFDRALAAYPVGSVFKLLIAAAALEQGIDPSLEWQCDGSVSVGNVAFGCLKPHGVVNLAQALGYSCNCYFIHLAQQLDIEAVLTMAQNFGFGKQSELADGLLSASGTLPTPETLLSAAAKANFSFGQGSLTATVLQVASLYATVFSGGDHYTPYLIKGLIDEAGNYTQTHEKQPPFKPVSRENAELLSDFLEAAVREGTGKSAWVEGADCKGKTATAQSGDHSSGKERLVSWFAGGFSYRNKQYAMVILCDDGTSGSVDCAPVFASTVRRILSNGQ